MRGYRIPAAIWLVAGLFVLAGCAAQPAGTAATAGPAARVVTAATAGTAAPALPQGMARVWMLRHKNVEYPNFSTADPLVYINGASMGQIAQGTVFYRDVQPGTYRFTVQAYGIPAHLSDPVKLNPGRDRISAGSGGSAWEVGSNASGLVFADLTMVPQDAEAEIPTFTYLGPR